jgi:glycosyltransferase involved in cell wall biosynthesis
MKAERIDVLRTHQYHANLYGRIAGRLTGVPVIIPSFHNLYHSPEKPKLHRRILNYLLNLVSDRLVAVSRAVAGDMVRYDKAAEEKIRIIYNGVELAKFRPPLSRQEARDALNLPQDAFLIGAAGRLTKQKGHRVLITAASSVSGVAVAFAGAGPCRDELEQLARSLDVRCFFLGGLPPEKMPVFFRGLDIFCFPSLWEGFGTAIVEAMAAGLPVLASDIAPHREVLSDAGILFESGNPLELKQVLREILSDQERISFLRAKTLSRAEYFSLERTVRTYEDLYIEVLKEKRLE